MLDCVKAHLDSKKVQVITITKSILEADVLLTLMIETGNIKITIVMEIENVHNMDGAEEQQDHD